jgi:outer membrane protein OmpA-like peptidoglycan-associated protein
MKTLNAAAFLAAAALSAACATSGKPGATAAAPPVPPPAPATAAAAPLTPAEAAEARSLALALERIHFALDSAALTPGARAALDEAARHLAAIPDLHLSVEGHADARGDAAWNRDLAEWRAATVIDYLAAKGIDRSRLELVAHGEEAPLALGEDAAAHAMNRRVEFHLLRGDVELRLRDGHLVDDAGRSLDLASLR